MGSEGHFTAGHRCQVPGGNVTTALQHLAATVSVWKLVQLYRGDKKQQFCSSKY